MCAYSLPGLPDFENIDYQDDGEHGGGRALLELLKGNKITCCALFVARYCKSEKLGSIRFQRIQEAAAKALNMSTLNPFTNVLQRIDMQAQHTVCRANQTKTQEKGRRGPPPIKGGHMRHGATRDRQEKPTEDKDKVSFHPIDEQKLDFGNSDPVPSRWKEPKLANYRGGGYEKDWPKVTDEVRNQVWSQDYRAKENDVD